MFRYETQVGLVRNSWSDLFVLGLAQISGQVAIPSLLSIIVSHQQARLARDNTPINVKEVTASICKIHDYVLSLSKLNLTQTEFAYLRTIALFGAGKSHFISYGCKYLCKIVCELLTKFTECCKCVPAKFSAIYFVLPILRGNVTSN